MLRSHFPGNEKILGSVHGLQENLFSEDVEDDLPRQRVTGEVIPSRLRPNEKQVNGCKETGKEAWDRDLKENPANLKTEEGLTAFVYVPSAITRKLIPRERRAKQKNVHNAEPP